jgi:hypothetical protein
MRVVDTCEEYSSPIAFYRHVFVQQHSNPHTFEIRYHHDRIVVPKDAIDVTLKNRPQSAYILEAGVEGTKGPSTIISRQNTQVIPQATDELRGFVHGVCAHVGM